MLLRLAAAVLLFASTAPAQGQTRTVTQLSYAAYAAGFHVLLLDAKADLGRAAYRVDLRFRTTGVFGFVFPAQFDSFAVGTWSEGLPAPQRYASWGVARGTDRRTVLDYPAGQPILREHIPEVDDERDPVPPGAERDSVDTLSAMAYLVRRVAETGACDGRSRLYDGHRVFEIVSRTVAREVLPQEDRSIYAGPALRCDFEGRQTAGYTRDQDDTERHRLHLSQAWLAPIVPGHPALPVRVMFETRFFGHATAYLTGAAPVR